MSKRGCVDSQWLDHHARRFEMSCQSCLTMRAGTSCSTAIQYDLSAREQSGGALQVVLTALEIRALVDHLALRERTLALLAASTGLRQSELFGLKWRDVDFQHGELSVTRSIVFGVVGRCKTESSQKPVPLHPQLRDALLTWRATCKFTGYDDWISASRLHKGRRPYWGASFANTFDQLPSPSIFRSASAGILSDTPTRRCSGVSEQSSK